MKIFSLSLLLVIAFSTLAQDRGRRSELEESLQSRYRVTTLGGRIMGIGGDNSIRRAGGVAILVRSGLFGSYDRGNLSSNGIQNGKVEVFSGNKDVALASGEKFYVTSVYVGTDVITLWLLSLRMIPGGAKPGPVWLSASFFFDKDTLAQADFGKVVAILDQWIVPEGAAAAPLAPAPLPPVATTPAPAAPVDLKVGMASAEIVNAMGKPLQDINFGDHRWLTYPGITVALEQDKLSSVDRNAQALVPLKVTSEPDHAEISLDGNFVGSTPAVLRLQPGTYKIGLKMAGYSDWQRDLKILPGAEQTLHAPLNK